MLDPRHAAVVFTPAALRHQSHVTVGQLVILPAAEAALALDAPAEPGDHVLVSRPPQRRSFAEVVAVVPEGEADPIKGALLTAVRLVTLDGLQAETVFGAFAANVAGFCEALEAGRIRDRQRLVGRRRQSSGTPLAPTLAEATLGIYEAGIAATDLHRGGNFTPRDDGSFQGWVGRCGSVRTPIAVIFGMAKTSV